MKRVTAALFLGLFLPAALSTNVFAQAKPAGQTTVKKFEIIEATIADIQRAIRAKQITSTDLVNMYLQRIRAYNGVCVNQPQGILDRAPRSTRAGPQLPVHRHQRSLVSSL